MTCAGLVGAGISADEFAADPARIRHPRSVIGFLRGELGDPPADGPSRCVRRRSRVAARQARPELTPTTKPCRRRAHRQAGLNRLLFPGPTKEYKVHRDTFGDTSRLSANQFWYGLRQGEEHRIKIDEPGAT